MHMRVRRLREAGVIRGFQVILDPRRAGLGEEAYVFVQAEPGLKPRVLEALRRLRGVYELYDVSGEYQVLAKIRASSKEGLADVIDAIGSVPGVLATRTVYVLRAVVERFALDLGSGASARREGGNT